MLHAYVYTAHQTLHVYAPVRSLCRVDQTSVCALGALMTMTAQPPCPWDRQQSSC